MKRLTLGITMRLSIALVLIATSLATADVGPLSMPADDALSRIDDLRAKLARDDARADQWTELGWLLYRYGQDTAGALKAVERACALDDTLFKAQELAGRLEFLRGYPDRSLHYWVGLLNDTRPETQMYLGAVATLARTDTQRAEVLKAMRRVADEHTNQLFRTIAKRYLAQVAIQAGRFDEAKQLYAAMGMIDTWMVIGPFSNERNAGYDTAYGPETEIDYSTEYQGRDRPVRWQPLRHYTFDRQIDLSAIHYPRNQVLAYLVTYIQSPDTRNVTLRIGVSKSVKVWFNDRLCYQSELDRRFTVDQQTIPLTLAAGYNKLLIKVGVESGGWRLAARLTEPNGRPLTGVTFTEEKQVTPDQRDAAPASFGYAMSVMDHYKQVSQRDPSNEDALYYLGLAQQTNRLPTLAGETFERLMRINDRCGDHHRLLARAYLRDDKAEKALRQIKRGLDVSPDNLQLRLMLARFYHGSQLLEKERSVLTDIGKRNPDWRALQLEWVQNFNAEGWEELAFRKLEKLHTQEPTDLSTMIAYARMCAGRGYVDQFNQLVARVLEIDHTDGMALRSELERAIGDQRYDDAFKIYDRMHLLTPLVYAIGLDRAKLLTSLKRYDEAIEQCNIALDICPTDFAIHRQLGVIYQRMHNDEAALKSFKTALTYRPDHRQLRQYVEYLEPEENAAFEHYALSREAVDGLLHRPLTAAEYPKSDSIVVLDEMVTQMFDDGSNTYRIHQVIKVIDEAGRDQWSQVGLPNGTNRVTRAVVVQPDGSEVEAANITNQAVYFAQLQPGSIIDYVVIGYAPANNWISHEYNETFVFQTGDPMVRSRFVLLCPAGKEVNTWHRGEGVTHTTEVFQAQDVRIWEARNIPRIESEPNSPPVIDLCAQVRVSTIHDWNTIAHWEHSLIKEQFQPDHDLTATTHELTDGLATIREKIKALADFVSQNIQYKIVRGGIFGYKPNKAANVLHNEWGDCKDKATLLITMLKQIGIDAQYATLRTRDAGRLIGEIPSNQCNHAIVLVPKTRGLTQDLWIDGTALDQGISALPWTDQGVTAMVWDDEGRLKLTQTPLEPAEATVSRFQFDVDISPDGTGKVHGRWTTTGQIAAGLRGGLRQSGQRSQRLTQMLNSFAPGSTLTDYTVSDLEDRDLPIVVDMTFEASNYAVTRDSELLLRARRPFQATARFAPRSIRRYDVWLPFRRVQNFSETYHLPKGYVVVSTPEAVDFKTPWMEYHTTVSQTGDVVTVARTLIVNAIEVPQDRYDELRAFCIRVDEYENGAVVRAKAKE